MTNSPYQLFPDLPDDEYQQLKQSIREHGVLVQVEMDDEGNILDGHHRVRAWTELVYEGAELETYPKIIRDDLKTESAKRAHVRRLNMLRRHLTQEQRRDLIRDQVRETPERSNRQVGATLGVSHHTVENVRQELESSGQIAQIAERTVERSGQTYTQKVENIGRRPAPVHHAPDPEIRDDYIDDVCQDADENRSPSPGSPLTSMPPRPESQDEQAMSDTMMETVFDIVPGARERVELAQRKAAYSAAIAGTRRNLLPLKPEFLIEVLDQDDIARSRSFISDMRAWLDGFESALSKGLRVVGGR